jgi:hypothetical protein
MAQQFIHSGKQMKATSSRKGSAVRGDSHRVPAVQPALQRALADPSSAAPETIIHLQRAIGNQAVGRLLTGGLSQPVQAKLRVGSAGDTYEQEADRVADQALNIPAPRAASNRRDSSPVQRQSPEDEDDVQLKPLAGTITPLLTRRALVQQTMVQRESPEEEELKKASLVQREGGEEDEEENVQLKPADGAVTMGRAGGEAGTEVESSIQNAKGSGQALENGFRGQMENAFGVDFSRVRVHTGGEADLLNRSLQSRAFTTGQDLFFREGEYNPGTSGGQRLIAHELTHVIQQTGPAPKSPPKGDNS